MSSPEAIYYRNLITLPEKKYATCSTQIKKSPSVYIDNYNGSGGSHTREVETRTIKFFPSSKMGNLGYDKIEIIKTKNPSRINPNEEVYITIFKDGESFLIEKGKNIIKQLAKHGKLH